MGLKVDCCPHCRGLSPEFPKPPEVGDKDSVVVVVIRVSGGRGRVSYRSMAILCQYLSRSVTTPWIRCASSAVDRSLGRVASHAVCLVEEEVWRVQVSKSHLACEEVEIKFDRNPSVGARGNGVSHRTS